MIRRPCGYVRLGIAGDAEHGAGAGCGVVDGADDAGLGQHVIVRNEEQVDHEADDFAGGEVLSGSFVGDFGELANESLEDRAHLRVADCSGVEVDAANFSATW
jgi:hypothetical protein